MYAWNSYIDISYLNTCIDMHRDSCITVSKSYTYVAYTYCVAYITGLHYLKQASTKLEKFPRSLGGCEARLQYELENRSTSNSKPLVITILF